MSRFFQIVGIVIVILIGAFILIHLLYPDTPTQSYLVDKTHSPSREFIRNAFKHIPKIPYLSKKGLMIGAEIGQVDLPYLEERGYEVIAQDAQTILWKVFPSKRVKVIETLDPFPKVDLVMASYILPFYGYFDTYWDKITSNINSKGYFIGNFFAPDSVIDQKQKNKMTFHTKDQVKDLFKDFVILEFEEVKNVDKDGRVEHYFEVLAQKK